jgi:copper(I)-binding protein
VRLGLAGGLVAALAGCGSSATTSTSSAVPTSSAAASTFATTGLSLKDGWAKAAPSGMTAIFGTLDNPTGQDITVMSGTSPVADMVQLHEVVTVNGAPKMQPKVGGFLVPAHGSHVLQPGGDHIMVMGLKKAIRAGDTVPATLTLRDGSTVQITAIGKDFAGANETYASPGAGTRMSAETSMSPGKSMSGMRPSMSPSS